MDSNVIQNYIRYGLPLGKARKYAIIGNRLIERASGKEYAPVDRINDIINDLRTEDGFTMRGVYDNLRARFSNISFRKIRAVYANDEAIQIKRHTKKRQFNSVKTVEPVNPFDVCQIDLTEAYETWRVDNPIRRVLRRGNVANKDYIFTFIDKVSRWCYAEMLRDKSAASVLVAYEHMLEQLPNGVNIKVLSMDNGLEFQGVFRDFVLDSGVNIIYAEPYNPISHANIERFNKTLKMIIDRWLDRDNDNRLNAQVLRRICQNLNDTVNEATGQTPNDMILQNRVGRQRRNAIAINKPAPFAVGDRVRVAMSVINNEYRKKALQHQLKKSLTENWTRETYVIKRVIVRDHNKLDGYILDDDDFGNQILNGYQLLKVV